MNNQKNEDQIQQGDVMLMLSALPKGCKKLPRHNRGVVLAEGEHHGHYHACDEDGLALMESPDGRRFVVNENGSARTFTHQEHKPVTVPAHSIAQLGIVREKDWFADMIRPVID